MRPSKLLTIAVVCLLALCCSACSANVAAKAPPTKLKTFNFRIIGEPETLDWNRAHTPIETYILLNIMEGLLAFDGAMKVSPALAQSWTISPDGKTYTFKLRPDVKWSDGVPLKARDFVYSWKRLLSPMTAAAYAYFLFDVEGAENFNKGLNKDFGSVGIKALDDVTFQVRLAHPVAHWITIPTFWVTFPLREDVVQKNGSDWEKPGRMVTLGPYKLVAHDIDSKIVLRPNPNYHGKRGNIEEINALIVKDATTAVTLYESGKLDFVTDLSTLDVKRFSSSPDFKVFPYLKTAYLGLVVDKFPLTNLKVRRAIAMAIDKSKFGELLYGKQQAATTLVPPSLIAYSKTLGLPYDPVRAKAELRASGLDMSRPLNLDLVIPNWDKPLNVAQFIQGELHKNLGLSVNLQPFDNKTFRAQVDLRAYPLFQLSWSADYPDPDNFVSLFLSSSGNNRTTWKNAQYDQRVLAARRMPDLKAREKIYLQLQKQLLEEETVIIPLYYEPNIALVRPRVKGLELNPINYLLLKKVSVD